MAIPAYFEDTANDDQRRGARRMLRLEAQGAGASGEGGDVLIHNISTSGLLLETALALALGETIVIDLPHAGAVRAKVVWSSGTMVGCQFAAPISPAALSAAQLRGQAAPLADEGFGVRLQRLRKERRLTLAQIAQALGVSRPTVWAWEQGRAHPVASRMEALAEALGVEPRELQPGREGAGPLGDLIARSRQQIAAAAGARPEQVRIMIEL